MSQEAINAILEACYAGDVEKVLHLLPLAPQILFAAPPPNEHNNMIVNSKFVGLSLLDITFEFCGIDMCRGVLEFAINYHQSMFQSPNNYSKFLNIAAKNNKVEHILLLSEFGCPVTDAIHCAVENGSLEVCQCLLAINPVTTINIVNEAGETALFAAAFHRKFDICKLLLTAGAAVNHDNFQGAYPIFNPCRQGLTEIVKLLIDYGANITTMDVSDQSPLILAASHDHYEVVNLLIQHGADPWSSSAYLFGCPTCFLEHGLPLVEYDSEVGLHEFLALMEHDYDVTQLRLEDDSDNEPNILTEVRAMFMITHDFYQYGNLPIMFLQERILTHCKDLSALFALFERGFVNTTVQNKYAVTAISHAIIQEKDHIARKLFEYVSDFDILVPSEDGNGIHNLLYQVILHHYKTNIARTKRLVSDLIQNGASVNAVNWRDCSPLIIASTSSNLVEVAQILLHAGAHVNHQDDEGDSALHVAVSHTESVDGQKSIVHVLLEAGADSTLSNHNDETAIYIAERNNNQRAMQLIESFMTGMRIGDNDDDN